MNTIMVGRRCLSKNCQTCGGPETIRPPKYFALALSVRQPCSATHPVQRDPPESKTNKQPAGTLKKQQNLGPSILGKSPASAGFPTCPGKYSSIACTHIYEHTAIFHPLMHLQQNAHPVNTHPLHVRAHYRPHDYFRCTKPYRYVNLHLFSLRNISLQIAAHQVGPSQVAHPWLRRNLE